MDDIEHMDYEAEVRLFRNKLVPNQNTLQRTLATCKMESSSRLQQHRTTIMSMKDKLERTKQRVDELRQQINQREVLSSQAKEDTERMVREIEKATQTLHGKKEEVDRQKEELTDYVEKLKEKEQWAAETRQRNQSKVGLVESSVHLFMTHLGLEITCTQHNTMIFKFTQVSRANPEAEYLLEVALEGDNYRLVTSQPPLPCFPQLQEALATSGNLTDCLVQVRRLYQRTDSKRPLE